MKVSTKLSPTDWINAGFRALAKGGVSGLRVEALGRDIGASKGSFYWHFKDVQALKTAMLNTWVDVATIKIGASVDAQILPPNEALRALVGLISEVPGDQYGGASIEPAIRDWSRFDNEALQTVTQIDRDRIAYVAELFQLSGHDKEYANECAELFYATFVGLEHLRMNFDVNIERTMAKLLAGLLRDSGEIKAAIDY